MNKGVISITAIIIGIIIGVVVVVGIIATQKKSPVFEEPLFTLEEEVGVEDEIIGEPAEEPAVALTDETCAENWNCTEWGSCANGQQTRTCTDLNDCGTVENKPDEQQGCEIQIINCGSNILSEETLGNMPNFDCFIEASENCASAKLLNTLTMEVFGMLSIGTTYMELKGMESNKCIYYQRIESNSVEFTDEMVQLMLDNGVTQEEINQQEQIANDSAQETVGMQKTCKFNKEDLTAMLNRWKEGSFSSEDWDVAECTPHSNIECMLQTTTMVSSIQLTKGVSTNVSVSGFKGDSNDVSWISQDTNIATVDPATGATTTIAPQNVGTTQVIAVDNAVGSDCKISIEVVTFQPY